jgi:mono/diheme cytochrome c family protein
MVSGAITLVLAGVVVGFAILLSGTVSTEATKQHFAITHRLLDLGLRFSVRQSASGIEAPPLDDPAMIATGLACFRIHCAQCHGAPAVGNEAHAQGLLPTPSNLAETAREWPAEWLYYVTKKGVRMTGMPAWEYRISDEGLWSTVAFLKRLPALKRAKYAALAARASAECPPSLEPPVGPWRATAKTVFLQYSCHSCHVIEGVVGPDTHVGPPLVEWRKRRYIAGVLPNTRNNLVRWIMDPHDVSPQTLMPDLDVAEAHAQDMARYLFTVD